MRMEELAEVLDHVRCTDEQGRSLLAHAIVAQHDQLHALQAEIRAQALVGVAPSDRVSKALTACAESLGRLLERAGMLTLKSAAEDL
jgi:hypothetical protein